MSFICVNKIYIRNFASFKTYNKNKRCRHGFPVLSLGWSVCVETNPVANAYANGGSGTSRHSVITSRVRKTTKAPLQQ